MIGYYVSVIDGKKSGMLLGPFDTHEAALANVDRGTKLAYDADPKAPWYAYGTCKWEADKLPRSVFGV